MMVVMTLEFVDEILRCDHSNKTLQQYVHMTVFEFQIIRG